MKNKNYFGFIFLHAGLILCIFGVGCSSHEDSIESDILGAWYCNDAGFFGMDIESEEFLDSDLEYRQLVVFLPQNRFVQVVFWDNAFTGVNLQDLTFEPIIFGEWNVVANVVHVVLDQRKDEVYRATAMNYGDGEIVFRIDGELISFGPLEVSMEDNIFNIESGGPAVIDLQEAVSNASNYTDRSRKILQSR